MKKLAEKILREYIDFEDVNGHATVELLPLTIVDAMIEFADELKTNKMKTKKRLKNLEELAEFLQEQIDELKLINGIEPDPVKRIVQEWANAAAGAMDVKIMNEYPPDPERWVECIKDDVIGLYKGGRYEIIRSAEHYYKLKGFVAQYAKNCFKPIPKP